MISILFDLTAFSLGTSELGKLMIQKWSQKGCNPKNVRAYACVFLCPLSLSPFSRVSVKGYVGEPVVWLQPVSVNEKSIHDIISLLTCAIFHMCLRWNTLAAQDWGALGLKPSTCWKDTVEQMVRAVKELPNLLPLVALFIKFFSSWKKKDNWSKLWITASLN